MDLEREQGYCSFSEIVKKKKMVHCTFEIDIELLQWVQESRETE